MSTPDNVNERAESLVDEVGDQLADLELQYRDARSAIANEDSHRRVQAEEIFQSPADRSELVHQIVALTNEQKRVTEELASRDKHVLALREQIDQLEARVINTADANARVREAETSLREERREGEKLRTLIDARVVERDEISSALRSLEVEKVQLRRSVDTVADERDEAQAERDELRKQLHRAQAQAARERREHEQLSVQLSAHGDQRDDLSRQISGLKEELAGETGRTHELEALLERRTNEISHLKKVAARTDSQLATNEGAALELEARTAERDRLRRRLEAVESELTAQTTEAGASKKALELLAARTAERDHFEQRVIDLEDQLAAATDSRDSGRATSAELQTRTAERNYLEQRVVELEARIGSLRAQNQEWRDNADVAAQAIADRDDLRRLVTRLEREIGDLRDQPPVQSPLPPGLSDRLASLEGRMHDQFGRATEALSATDYERQSAMSAVNAAVQAAIQMRESLESAASHLLEDDGLRDGYYDDYAYDEPAYADDYSDDEPAYADNYAGAEYQSGYGNEASHLDQANYDAGYVDDYAYGEADYYTDPVDDGAWTEQPQQLSADPAAVVAPRYGAPDRPDPRDPDPALASGPRPRYVSPDVAAEPAGSAPMASDVADDLVWGAEADVTADGAGPADDRWADLSDTYESPSVAAPVVPTPRTSDPTVAARVQPPVVNPGRSAPTVGNSDVMVTPPSARSEVAADPQALLPTTEVPIVPSSVPLAEDDPQAPAAPPAAVIDAAPVARAVPGAVRTPPVTAAPVARTTAAPVTPPETAASPAAATVVSPPAVSPPAVSPPAVSPPAVAAPVVAAPVVSPPTTWSTDGAAPAGQAAVAPPKVAAPVVPPAESKTADDVAWFQESIAEPPAAEPEVAAPAVDHVAPEPAVAPVEDPGPPTEAVDVIDLDLDAAEDATPDLEDLDDRDDRVASDDSDDDDFWGEDLAVEVDVDASNADGMIAAPERTEPAPREEILAIYSQTLASLEEGERGKGAAAPAAAAAAGAAAATAAGSKKKKRRLLGLGAGRKRIKLPPDVDEDSAAAAMYLVGLANVTVLVDGESVSERGWSPGPGLSPADHLVNGLSSLAARSDAKFEVVFDGSATPTTPSLVSRPGVRVRFVRGGVSISDVLVRLTDAFPPTQPVVVTSSEGQLREVLRKTKVNMLSATQLADLIKS